MKCRETLAKTFDANKAAEAVALSDGDDPLMPG